MSSEQRIEHERVWLHGGPGLRPEPTIPVTGRAIHVVIACTEDEAAEWRRDTGLGVAAKGLLDYFMRRGASTVDIRYEMSEQRSEDA